MELTQIIGLVIAALSLLATMVWRSYQAESGIKKSISDLAVIIEKKDTKAIETLHQELAKVYTEINDVRQDVHKLKSFLAEQYLKKNEITQMVKEGNASLSREIINVEKHIQISLDRYLTEFRRND